MIAFNQSVILIGVQSVGKNGVYLERKNLRGFY